MEAERNVVTRKRPGPNLTASRCVDFSSSVRLQDIAATVCRRVCLRFVVSNNEASNATRPRGRKLLRRGTGRMLSRRDDSHQLVKISLF